ncbi:MAG TPA: DUF502 domain-containing protein [Saprospiraceae bacterium]|nr:DUF502 domain-containing protein [Saprospiraceae bacterium]
MKKLIGYLIQGLLWTAPLAITGYIIYEVFEFVDNILQQVLTPVIGIHIPGLGLGIIVVMLMAVGFLGQTIIARPLKAFFNKILERIPLLKFMYSALNDLFSAFVGKEKRFNQPVLVLVNPVTNLEKLGFITDEDLKELPLREKVAVYFPHSYNFSGELYIVPKSQVTPLDISPGEVMKYVVSAGITRMEINNKTK